MRKQVATVTRLRTVPSEPLFSRDNPFPAEILGNQRLTARDATKDVRHIEINLAGSGLKYEPGDALGVWHENPAAVVDAVLAAAHLDGAQIVELDGQARTLREWLTIQPRNHAAHAPVPGPACRARRRRGARGDAAAGQRRRRCVAR